MYMFRATTWPNEPPGRGEPVHTSVRMAPAVKQTLPYNAYKSLMWKTTVATRCADEKNPSKRKLIQSARWPPGIMVKHPFVRARPKIDGVICRMSPERGSSHGNRNNSTIILEYFRLFSMIASSRHGIEWGNFTWWGDWKMEQFDIHNDSDMTKWVVDDFITQWKMSFGGFCGTVRQSAHANKIKYNFQTFSLVENRIKWY